MTRLSPPLWQGWRTSSSTMPFRPRIAPMPAPKALRIFCPAMPAASCKRSLRLLRRLWVSRCGLSRRLLAAPRCPTKLELLGNLVGKVDVLVIGGAMANTFLAAQGLGVGKSLQEADMHPTALDIMRKARTAGCEIVLPSERGCRPRSFGPTRRPKRFRCGRCRVRCDDPGMSGVQPPRSRL